MKTFALLLLAALSGLAQASWDGTKGNLTIKTLSDAHHTAISVAEADRSVLLLSATIAYTAPCEPVGCAPLTTMTVQYASCEHDKLGSGSSMFVFDMPVGVIKSILITEWRPGNSTALSAGAAD